jgi:tetratricopeptide (TPR) repeat protein
MSLRDLISKLVSGDAKIKRIGSLTVAPNASPEGVAAAVEIADRATKLSQQAKLLTQQNRWAEAAVYLQQSIVLEDSIGNKYGMASDLGNLAGIYVKLNQHEKAKGAYETALKISKALLDGLPALHARMGTPGSLAEFERSDYSVMYGMHLEGFARCLIASNLQSARDHALLALDAYRNGNSAVHIAQVQELVDWMDRKLAARRAELSP